MLKVYLTICFAISHLFLLFPIKKLILAEKVDHDFLFLYITNAILLLFFFYYFVILEILLASLFVSFFLMIFSYTLIYHTKNCLGKYQLFSLPYFFISVYTFANILMLYLF